MRRPYEAVQRGPDQKFWLNLLFSWFLNHSLLLISHSEHFKTSYSGIFFRLMGFDPNYCLLLIQNTFFILFLLFLSII